MHWRGESIKQFECLQSFCIHVHIQLGCCQKGQGRGRKANCSDNEYSQEAPINSAYFQSRKKAVYKVVVWTAHTGPCPPLSMIVGIHFWAVSLWKMETQKATCDVKWLSFLSLALLGHHLFWCKTCVNKNELITIQHRSAIINYWHSVAKGNSYTHIQILISIHFLKE